MDKCKKFLKEYWILPVIAILIIFLISQSDTKTNTKNAGENEDYIEYSLAPEYDIDTSNDNAVDIKATNDGYDILDKNDQVIVSLTSDTDINRFVAAIKNNKPYEMTSKEPAIPKQIAKVGIVIDNTFSYIGNNLLTSLPQKRLEQAIEYFKNNDILSDGVSGKIGWLFANNFGTPQVNMNDEVFSFSIDSSRFTSAIIGNKKDDSNIEYYPQRKKLVLENIVLSSTFVEKGEVKDDKCIYTNSYAFVCRTPEDFYQEIDHIYHSKYEGSGDATHQGTFLLDYLFTKAFYDLNDLYIFTDGEFQIAKDTSNAFLKSVNSSYHQQKTLDFSAQTFNQNLSWYPDYRLAIARSLQGKLVSCSNNKLEMIGLNSSSAAFIDFARGFYPKLFAGCIVSFNP